MNTPPLILVIIFGTALCAAAQVTWDGGGGNANWSSAANWVGDVAPAGSAGSATFSGSVRTTNINDLSGLSFSSLTFNNSDWSVSGNTFTLSGALTGAAGRNATISNDITQSSSATYQTQSTAGSSLTLSGNLSGGSTAITKDGSGTSGNADTSDLIFNGSGKVITSGTMILRKGGLIFENGVSGNFTGGTQPLQIGNDATHNGIDPFVTIRGAGTSVMVGAGTVEIGRAANAARLNMEGGTFTAAALLTGQNAASSGSGFTQSGGTMNITSLRLGNAAGSVSSSTITGGTLNIGQATATVSKLVEAGTSTLTVGGGTVVVKNLSSNASAAFQLATGAGNGTLNLNGGTLETSGFVKGNATGTSIINLNGGTLRVGASNASFLSTLENTSVRIGDGGAFIDTNSFDAGVAAVLQGNGTGGLTKNGAGTLTLSAANTFTGATTINAGNLTISNALALQNSAFNSDGAGTLVLSSVTTPTLGGLSGSGNLSAKISNYNTVTALTLNVTSGGNYSYSGVISNGSGATTLTKTGTGTQVLSGNNTYTGTTRVISGTLEASGTGALGANPTLNIEGGGLVFSGGTHATTTTGTLGSIASGGVNEPSITVRGVATQVTFNQLNIGANANAGRLVVESGTLNATTILTGQNASALAENGFYQTGGTANIGTLRNANNGLGVTQVTGGSLNVTTMRLTEAGSGAFSLSGTGLVSIGSNGSGSFNLANGIGNGTLNLNGGTLTLGSFTKTNTTGSTLINLNGGTLRAGASSGSYLASLTNTIVQIGNGGLVFDSNGFDSTIASALSANGSGGVSKSGAGALTLSGANTFTGLTSITEGALIVQNAGALGANATGTSVGSGAALHIQGNITISGEALSLNGTGVFAGGALKNLSGTNVFTGAITLDGGSTITSDAGLLTLSGGLSGNANLAVDGAGNLTISSAIQIASAGITKNGAGTLTLSAANTFTGATTINAGNLTISNALALQNSAFNSDGAGTLVLSSVTTPTLGGLSGSGNLSAKISNYNTVTALTLNVTSGGNYSYSGVISNGSGATTLTKTGTGTQVLSGNNTYTGTTRVISGTLEASGTGALGANPTLNIEGGGLVFSGGTHATTTTGTLGSIASGGVNEPSITVRGVATQVTFNQLNIGANANAGRLVVESGTLNATTILTGQNASALAGGGLLQTGGVVNVTNLRSANNGASLIEVSGGTFNMGNGGTSSKLVEGGNGTLTISGSGLVQLLGSNGNSTFNLATSAGSGTINLNGGTLSVGGFAKGNSTGSTVINLNGGILQARSNSTNFLGNLANTTVRVGNGGLTVDTNGFDITIAAPLVANGNGGLSKTGSGTLTLNGTNTFTGVTTVQSGTLRASSSGALASTSSVVVSNGGSLLVTANESVSNSASLNLAGGTLALSGNVTETVGALTLSANSSIDFGEGNATLYIADILQLGIYTLNIYNWTGGRIWGGGGTQDRLYVAGSLSNNELSAISFYSGFAESSFLGNGFEILGSPYNEIIAVPEPSTWVLAGILVFVSFFMTPLRKVIQPSLSRSKNLKSR